MLLLDDVFHNIMIIFIRSVNILKTCAGPQLVHIQLPFIKSKCVVSLLFCIHLIIDLCHYYTLMSHACLYLKLNVTIQILNLTLAARTNHGLLH